MTTATAPVVAETCDRCNARAACIAELKSQYLHLCRHHTDKNRDALVAKGWTISTIAPSVRGAST
jgi:hypothetical protein